MALVNSYGSKMRKPFPPKKAMLKDFLLDDLSSCSSNGFRSFPRRPCCATTVRFLDPNQKQKALKKNKPKSLLKRASSAVISAALKLLSKPRRNSRAPEKSCASFLPRSLSRRLKKWKSTKYLAVSNNVGVESSPECWGDGGYFNCDYLLCSGGNSASKFDNNVVSGFGSGSPEVAVSDGVNFGGTSVASTTTTSSTENNKWQNEEAKEQFSPGSVLDFPSADEEEVSSPDEVSSPFQARLDCVEGRKKKFMQKLRRFEGLVKLEPMDLSKKFALSDRTGESTGSRSPSASVHNSTKCIEEEVKPEQEGDEVARYKALDLLSQMKTMLENFSVDAEIILFDFFVDGVRESKGIKFVKELIFEARDWMKGNPRERFSGWEEAKNRLPYMKDMERGGKWNIRNRALDEHKEEVALELEDEILALLVNELVLDIE